VRAPLSLIKAANLWQPDVIQGWMYHGNVAASMAANAMLRRRPAVWSIRQSLYEIEKERRGTQVVIRIGRAISGTPALTIYNSREAAHSHSQLGFSTRRQLVIANGFDSDKFAPNREARTRIRRELAIPEGDLLIGHVARFHPIKGHRLLIDAVAAIGDRLPSATYLLVGFGVDGGNVELTDALRAAGLEKRVRLLGPRSDVPDLTAAFDIAVLSSEAESFPNVVAEAMACGVPVVATDVGDCAEIIGDTGVVCSEGDAGALASGIISLAKLGTEDRRSLGQRARARIVANYSLTSIAQRYWDAYSSVSGIPHGMEFSP
jgi:glycosyltransferase involved in cell wall biosynthesis